MGKKENKINFQQQLCKMRLKTKRALYGARTKF